MCDSVFGTFGNDTVTINQYKYPYHLYKSEVRVHETAIHEYAADIVRAMHAALEAARPNMKLYQNQPYVNAAVRFKLVDFLLKMLVRLKILPFVFCRAVRLFDRYCLKRIVLLDQAQLIITTCLWIAAKIHGGNNHFANLHSDNKDNSVRTITDLGYGCGARFKGPTERYRLPKLKELIKLCGSRCNYDANMFSQMELHIMLVLDWKLNDPSIDEYMVYSQELKVTADEALEAKLAEFFKIKQFVAYAACYLYELVGYDALEVAKVIVDLVNDTFLMQEHDPRYQTLNHSIIIDEDVVDYNSYRDIQRHLVRAVVKAPPYLLDCFESRGPRLLFSLLATSYRPAPECATYAALYSLASSAATLVFSDYPASSYTYASPAASIHNNNDSIPSSTPDYHYKACPEPKLPEGFSHVGRKNFAIRTPGVDPAHSHSHHYPPLVPPLGGNYARNNGSQVSLRLSALLKDAEIFDYDIAKYGLNTPMSGDEECKAAHDIKCKRRAI